MSNFDLRKFLAESKLHEENLADTRMEAEGDARIFHKDLVTKYGFDAVADALEAAYDNAEEGGMGYENIADTLKMDNSILIDMIEDTLIEEAMDKPSNKQKLIDAGYSESDAEDFADEFEQGGVKIPQKVKDILSEKSSSKMKMSELKKKIRQEILSELTLSEDNEIDLNISDPDKEYDFLDEATKDGDGKVPSKDADTDIEDIKDKEEVDIKVEKKPKAGPSGDFLDQLEDLKNEADDMGDNKLERQIDNTITYFTRQHIAKDTNESIELEEADNELEENLTKDQIQKKYNEMFGKNPQTKFADVAKALNTTEQEIAAALFFTPMFEADELKEADKDYYDAAERDDAAHIAALEKDMEDDKRSAMKESLEILKMKKLAGLLTEGEYAKALLKEYEEPAFDNASGLPPDFAQAQYDYEMEKSRDPFRENETNEVKENQVNNKYVVKDEKLSDEDYGFYYIDQQKAFDYLKQFNNSEVSAKQFIKDDEGWGEFEQYLDNIEQMSDKKLEDAMRQEMSYYFFSKPDEI